MYRPPGPNLTSEIHGEAPRDQPTAEVGREAPRDQPTEEQSDDDWDSALEDAFRASCRPDADHAHVVRGGSEENPISCFPKQTITAFPDECVVAIFEQLTDVKRICMLANTCRRLRELSATDKVWKHLFLFRCDLPRDRDHGRDAVSLSPPGTRLGVSSPFALTSPPPLSPPPHPSLHPSLCTSFPPPPPTRPSPGTGEWRMPALESTPSASPASPTTAPTTGG